MHQVTPPVQCIIEMDEVVSIATTITLKYRTKTATIEGIGREWRGGGGEGGGGRQSLLVRCNGGTAAVVPAILMFLQGSM